LRTRIFGFLTTALLFFVVLKTDSRLAFIGFCSTVVLYSFVSALSWWRRDRNSIAAGLVFWSYPAVAGAFLTLSILWHRLEVMIWGGGAQQSSTGARKLMYQSGLPMVLNNPIGHGMGQGAVTLGYYNPDGFLTIDTYYLAVALEYGLLGFIAYYLIFILAAWRGAKLGAQNMSDPDISYLLPIAIAFVNFLISKSVFSQQENHPLVFILLGMASALSFRAVDKDRRSRPNSVPSESSGFHTGGVF
jgi:O-antigen ligase